MSKAISKEKENYLKAFTKILANENKKLIKRMNEIEGSKKVSIEIPTVFYERILESKVNKVHKDLSAYITYLLAFDLGKD